MLRNYLTVTWRTLRRNKTYTAINVGGLALGLACCVLIALYVQDELSYDNFHDAAGRIVAIGDESTYINGEVARTLSIGYARAGALKREVPGVERVVRTTDPRALNLGRVGRDSASAAEEEGVFYAENGFFDVFTFSFVKGRPQTALAEPNTVVLSEELAQKYFPNGSPIGKTLHISKRGERTYRVTGVARSPEKSYLDFGAVLSFSTLDPEETQTSSFHTFVLLEEDASKKPLEKQLARLGEAHSDLRLLDEARFFALPITSLYLSDLVTSEGFRGEWRYLYLLGTVALFILLLACANYVNLSTARAAQRAKEVGVRRTVGAGRGQVARQLWGESVLLTILAFLLSLVLACAALPVFNHLTGKALSLFGVGAEFALLLFGAALAVGLLAGAYPAVCLSGFRPTDVLRGGVGRGRRGTRLRKGLVALQFAVAVALVAATGVVYQQLRYTQQKDLGFEKERLVVVTLPSALAGQRREILRRNVLAHASISSTTLASSAPAQYRIQVATHPEELSTQHQTSPREDLFLVTVDVGYDFVETMGLRLLAGRNLSRECDAGLQHAYLLNETATRTMGWTPQEAVGKPFSLPSDTMGTVVGVLEDYHNRSLRETVKPVALQAYKAVPASPHQLIARLAPGQIRAGLDHIEQQVARHAPDSPFEYEFLDEAFAQMYRTERRLGQVFSAFAVVAVSIACLGLFGLAAFAAERRTKEIAIRKTFGASARQIVQLLSKEFLVLVGAGFALAVPVAWYAMQRWLEDFAYRIALSPWLFAAAGLVALVVAMGATGGQALRAAHANPAEALKDE